MKATGKEIKQNSLIHQKNRGASFIPLKSPNTEKFKYNLVLGVSEYISDKFIALKTYCNKIIQRVQVLTQNIDFKAIRNDVSTWSIEALIEGFVINFIVWALMDWKFNLLTMLAWGFAIKQLLSIYWRLRRYGQDSKIPTKDK